MSKQNQVVGYLPDERPSAWKLFLYALQQVIVMFPATVTVALITGFHVSTTIFASGLATICFIMITGRKIPLYYGSSFAYLNAIAGLMAGNAIMPLLSPESQAVLGTWMVQGKDAAESVLAYVANMTPEALKQLPDALKLMSPEAFQLMPELLKTGVSTLPLEAISYAQFGIVMSGLVSIAAGLLVRFSGAGAVEKILPASITGPVAMIIGLTLAANALGDAYGIPQGVAEESVALMKNLALVVALVTLLSTILFSRYLKGFLGQLPLLLGAAVGCLTAAIIYWCSGNNLFDAMSVESVVAASSGKLGDGAIFALPAFSLPKFSLAAVLAIMPVAIATIPESTAHMYQLDIYVNDVAKKKGVNKKYDLIGKLDRNLIGDGIGDMITGLIGGPAGTNYGENISTMAITKVFSVPVLMVAAILAMVVSCFTPLIQAIYAIPTAVIGGLEIYLFGAIAAQGVAIMIDKKVDMFSAKNIAVIATIIVVGVGGQYAFGGNIPFFGMDVPCVAGAAIAGIVLNLLLSIGEKKEKEEA